MKLRVADECSLSKVIHRDRNEPNKINFYGAVEENPWLSLIDTTDLAECYENFSSKLYSLFDTNFPIRTVRKVTARCAESILY